MPITQRSFSGTIVKRQGDVVMNATNGVDSYFVQLRIGSPSQSVTVQLDTGSSYLCVIGRQAYDTGTFPCPENGCTFCVCLSSLYLPCSFNLVLAPQQLIPRNLSVALLYKGKVRHWDFDYATGSASGHYLADPVGIGDVKLQDVIIGLAVTVSDSKRPRVTPPIAPWYCSVVASERISFVQSLWTLS